MRMKNVLLMAVLAGGPAVRWSAYIIQRYMVRRNQCDETES